MSGSIVKRLEIIEVDEKTSKSGNKFRVCQCIVHTPNADGGTKKRVGELMVFDKDMVVTEGSFHGEFDIDVNFDKQVVAKLVRLVPVVQETGKGKGDKPF